jgi:hypothetical protein
LQPVKEKVEVMKRIACTGIGLVLTLGLLGLTAAAQSQSSPSSSSTSSSDSSLGDYAKQVRKTSNTTKPKVYDNDNLPVNDKLSIVGTAGDASVDNSADSKPADSASAAPASGDAKPGDAKAAEPKPVTGTDEEKAAATKQWAGKLSGQQDQIDLLSRELDVLQREYQIRAAAMYADAGNRMRNAADWDKQDAQYKQQIADKQKALDDAKQKLDDLQEEARKAGVPASVREQSTPAAPAQ